VSWGLYSAKYRNFALWAELEQHHFTGVWINTCQGSGIDLMGDIQHLVGGFKRGQMFLQGRGLLSAVAPPLENEFKAGKACTLPNFNSSAVCKQRHH